MFFNSAGLVAFGAAQRGGEKELEELLQTGEERQTVFFTNPWGIHFAHSSTIRCIKRSMEAYSEIKHSPFSRLVNKLYFQRSTIFIGGL